MFIKFFAPTLSCFQHVFGWRRTILENLCILVEIYMYHRCLRSLPVMRTKSDKFQQFSTLKFFCSYFPSESFFFQFLWKTALNDVDYEIWGILHDTPFWCSERVIIYVGTVLLGILLETLWILVFACAALWLFEVDKLSFHKLTERHSVYFNQPCTFFCSACFSLFKYWCLYFWQIFFSCFSENNLIVLNILCLDFWFLWWKDNLIKT